MSTEGLILTVAGGLAALAACPLCLILWRIARLRRSIAAAAAWPSVEGKVIAASLRESQRYVPSSGNINYYLADIAYEYTVEGRVIRSARYSLGGPRQFHRRSRAQRLLARFPVGTEVSVHYDPAHPDAGVLERRMPEITTLWAMFGFLLAFSSFFIGLLFIA